MLFFKSMAIGLSIAAPVGPIGALCIQRSLSYGFRSGFATGIGAACADMIYGLLGALGVAGIVTAWPALTVTLKVGGGAFLIWLAWSIGRAAPRAESDVSNVAHATLMRDFLTTFGLTLSNPMTIVAFIGVFAALGPLPAAGASHAALGWIAVTPMVAGVFAGSAVWWLCLSGTTAMLRKQLPDAFAPAITRASAVIIAVFGIVQAVTGLRQIV